MLHSAKDIENSSINAIDGQIGHVKDLYFDDEAWVIRYLVVKAGSWISNRLVLISPIAVHNPNWLARALPLSITKEQVKNSPGIDTDKPVSRQNEEEYHGYYRYSNYWGGSDIWGNGFFPYTMRPEYSDDKASRARDHSPREAHSNVDRAYQSGDPHLRSCSAVTGYRFSTTDGEIGHVADYLIDEKTWAIRYIVVDTGHWWSGHKVLLAPEWITAVHWVNKTVFVNLSRESVKKAPRYDPEKEWDRELDISLYKHYEQPGYWMDRSAQEKNPLLNEPRGPLL